MKKVIIYIDGGNFYQRIFNDYKLHFLSFQMNKFCNFLVEPNKKIIGIRYYIGQIKQYPNNQKSINLYNSQQKILQKIKNEGIYTVLGRIQKIGNTYKEKGVDMRIGLDLLEGAYEDKFDTALVISSDGDLAPALKMVRGKGKVIESVMFDKNYSFVLQKQANKYIILNEKDLLPFGHPRFQTRPMPNS